MHNDDKHKYDIHNHDMNNHELTNTLFNTIESNDIPALRQLLDNEEIDWQAPNENGFPLIALALEAVARIGSSDPALARLILLHWAKGALKASGPKERYRWQEEALDVEPLTWNWDWERDFNAETLLHLESDYASVYVYGVSLEDGTLLFVEHPHADGVFKAKPKVRAIGRKGIGVLAQREVLRQIVAQGAVKRLVEVSGDAGFRDGNELCVDGSLSTTLKQVYGARVLRQPSDGEGESDEW